MNMTKPVPYRTYPVEQTTIETTHTSEASNETETPAETTTQNETATQTDAEVSPEKTSPDIISTTELVSAIPADQDVHAEERTRTDITLPLPEVQDPDLLAQLRYQQGLDDAASAPRKKIVSVNHHNYDYYGELHDEIPPNVRGPEYPDLSPDIPVILNRTDKKPEKRLPAIPGWRLQFPDTPPKKEEISDGTPKTEKTTFRVNYDDYLNVINDGMKLEPLPVEGIGESLQSAPNFETKDLKTTAASGFNRVRALDYPSFHDMPVITDSIEDDITLSTHSAVPFNFDVIATGKEFMAQISRAGLEGMILPVTNLNAIKAMSPTYTVLHEEPTGTPTTGTSTTTTTETRTTTALTTKPTTTIWFSSTTTTEPTTTISVTSTTQPSTTNKHEFGYDVENHKTFFTMPPPSTYIQTYEIDWSIYSTYMPTLVTDYYTQEITTVPTTTPHPLVESLKQEMEHRQVGHFSVCVDMFFKIFSEKENNALRALLRGGSHALQKMNKDNKLTSLGPPIWPGTELGFLQMRIAPIEYVKRRASIVYKYYTSGLDFDVKHIHETFDNFLYRKEGEDLMQAVAEFDDFPGVNRDMNANLVMEHLFTAILAPYFRDKKNPKMQNLVKDINEKLLLASKNIHKGGGGRRNSQGNNKYTTTKKNNFKNKFAGLKKYVKRSKGNNDYEDSDDKPKKLHNNSDGNLLNNAVEPKDGIDETKTFHDSFEHIKTEKIKSAVVIDDNNKKFKKSKEYDDDSNFRTSKVKVIGPGIVNIRARTTNTGKKEKASKKIRCYGDECTATDTNALPKRASNNKYGQNEDSYRNDESKVGLLKGKKTRALIGHLKQTEMGLSVKHKIIGATILYDHDNNINKNSKKYTKRYNNAKKAFTSSNNDHNNKPLKDNKEKNTHHTNRARNNEANYKKFYLEIIKYNKSEPKHAKYGSKELKIYPKTNKKAKKDENNRLSKNIKVNTKYYANDGKTNYKKNNSEIFKYNKSETKTNDKKISYVKSKDKIKRKTEYISPTYEESPILQTKGTKSKNIRITRANSKISDISQKTTEETYDYETYDSKMESNLTVKKEINMSTNGKSELSKNKDDDYDTSNNRVNNKKIKDSKTTNTLRKDELNNKNLKRNAFRNSVKAKDYIKELRIRRSTKGKEYFRDIKQYLTTTVRKLKKTPHKKIDKQDYLKTKNYKIWSSSEKVDPNSVIFRTSKNNATENDVPQYENKKVLEVRNAPRAQNSEEYVNSFENKVKENYKEENLEQHDIQESKTVENTKFPGNRYTKLSERVLQKRFKQKQNPEAKNNEIHNNFSQSSKPQDVYSKAPDLKQKKNKTENIINKSEINKNKSSHIENNKKNWLNSKSQYIVNRDVPYLNERFLDFNRDSIQSKNKNILRNLDKDKNILRDESSYSDDEELLKSNLQDNLLHGGRKFTDTLPKHKKRNVIRDISSYSDEEDTLKKNIYKLFT